MGIGLGVIGMFVVAVIEVERVGVECKILCCDRCVAGDGDCAAACSNAAVHLQHRGGLVITGLGRRRDRDRVAIGIGTGLNTGDGRAGARGHGDGVQRLKFRGNFDQVDIHLPGEAALLAALMFAGVSTDETVAIRNFDIRDLVCVLKIKIIIEIIDVVCDFDAVDINVCGEEVDIVKLVFVVEHSIHVKLLLDFLPRQVEHRRIVNRCDIVCMLCHKKAVCARRHAAGDNFCRDGDGLARICRQEPVIRGIASAGRVGCIKSAVVFTVPVDVCTARNVHEFQMEHKHVAVPVQDRIIIGRTADLDAPGILAVVAGEAGRVSQVAGTDGRALRVTHGNAAEIIHIVAHVAAVSDDRKRTGAGHLARVIGICDVIRRSAVFDLTDQTAVVTAAGDGTPVEAVRHIRVIVGAAAQITGLAGDAAVRAVVVVVIGFNRARVPATADVRMVIGAAENTAGVVIRFDGADVPALFYDRFALVAVAEDAARRVVCGRDGAAVAAVVEFMIGVLAVAEDTADGVFARNFAGVIAVVELVLVIFHVTEDAAGIVVVAADAAVVFVVAPDAFADVAANDAARVVAAIDRPAVDVVFDGMLGVRVEHTGDTAADLGARFDLAFIDTAAQRHFLVLTLGAEIAENAARAGVRRNFTGIGAVCERGFVIFDPTCHAARVAVAGIDLTGVGTAVRDDAALGVADHAARAVVVGVDRDFA